jgi:hypothetical protein
MYKSAVIDPSGKYRYYLRRVWDIRLNVHCTFVMLNPSTADADYNDPTIKKCIRLATGWGCGGISVINVFAFRATYPTALLEAEDPEGPDNRRWTIAALDRADIIVAAWGNAAPCIPGDGFEHMIQTLAGRNIYCLEKNASGQPKHPLYVKDDTKLKSYQVPTILPKR